MFVLLFPASCTQNYTELNTGDCDDQNYKKHQWWGLSNKWGANVKVNNQKSL